MPHHSETKAVLQTLALFQQVQESVQSGQGAEPIPQNGSVGALVSLLRGDWILSAQGYFMNHRPGSPYAQLDDEYKVQDLVYCMATTIVPDIHYENPQKKTQGALASTRVDFSSEAVRTFLEVKLASNKHTAKKVEAEISEDIVKYGKHRAFDTLIFFVFCHNYAFPNAREFELGFTGDHRIAGHRFRTICIVKP